MKHCPNCRARQCIFNGGVSCDELRSQFLLCDFLLEIDEQIALTFLSLHRKIALRFEVISSRMSLPPEAAKRASWLKGIGSFVTITEQSRYYPVHFLHIGKALRFLKRMDK